MILLPDVARLAIVAMTAKAGRAAPRPDVVLAVAIAVAESGDVRNPRAGCNPTARNTNTNGSDDEGIWQINSIHKVSNRSEPAANAKAMASIAYSNGRWSWSPWSAFNQGRHVPALPAAGAAYDEALKGLQVNDPSKTGDRGGAGGTGLDPAVVDKVADAVVPDSLSRLTGVLGPLAKIATRLSDAAFWKRTGAFVGGLMLVVLGLAWLGRQEALNVVTGAASAAVKGARS